ncbi:MAG: aldo/keto reductase, partial [Myxococcaceae bacterium]
VLNLEVHDGVHAVRRAHRVHPIVDLQIEYSVASRGPEAAIFPALKELGISATLYGVFSRGLLTGSKPKGKGDFRAWLPRFTGENGEKNQDSVAAFQRFAQERRMTPGQLAIAWVLARQPAFVPVVGVKTGAQLDDALGALTRSLSKEDVTALESLVTISGERYGAEQMHHLDSERR